MKSLDHSPRISELRASDPAALKINSAQVAGYPATLMGQSPLYYVISGEIRRNPVKSGHCKIIQKRTSVQYCTVSQSWNSSRLSDFAQPSPLASCNVGL
jgi:hypothetical protein